MKERIHQCISAQVVSKLSNIPNLSLMFSSKSKLLHHFCVCKHKQDEHSQSVGLSQNY